MASAAAAAAVVRMAIDDRWRDYSSWALMLSLMLFCGGDYERVFRHVVWEVFVVDDVVADDERALVLIDLQMMILEKTNDLGAAHGCVVFVASRVSYDDSYLQPDFLIVARVRVVAFVVDIVVLVRRRSVKCSSLSKIPCRLTWKESRDSVRPNLIVEWEVAVS